MRLPGDPEKTRSPFISLRLELRQNTAVSPPHRYAGRPPHVPRFGPGDQLENVMNWMSMELRLPTLSDVSACLPGSVLFSAAWEALAGLFGKDVSAQDFLTMVLVFLVMDVTSRCGVDPRRSGARAILLQLAMMYILQNPMSFAATKICSVLGI